MIHDRSAMRLPLSSSSNSSSAILMVSGIRSFTSHLAIVLGFTDSLLANSTWLKRQLFRPSFNSDPVMLSIWSICMRLSNLNPCHWQFVTNRVPISDILSCGFYLGEKKNPPPLYGVILC